MSGKPSRVLLLMITLQICAIESVEECADKRFSSSFVCCIGNKTDLINAFGSVKIELNCNTSECTVATGSSPEDVDKALPFWIRVYNTILSIFTVDPAKNNDPHQAFYFSPYVDVCIKVDVPKNSVVKMRKRMQFLDMTCIAMLIAGLVLFFSAEKLSSSVKFYYTGGVGLGVLASLLIVVFILSRFVPKKPAAYSILLGGWSICYWILKKVWSNWNAILLEYKLYFLGYIGLAAFISFSLCYWKGPIQDARTQHIIQWSIQLAALIMLYNSSQATIISCSLVLGSVLVQLLYLTPSNDALKKLKNLCQKLRRTRPEPRRLLTEEEYRREAEIETKKALDELRQYCDSPKCSPWKTLSRIKKQTKFVNFMEGESHVSDAEMTLHNEEVTESDSAENEDLVSDDDSDSSTNETTTKRTYYVEDHISDDED